MSLRSIDADKIGFFFGAGASIEFGIPSMKQITTNFADEIIDKGGDNKERQTFDLIYNSLADVYGEDKVDLEAIISLIAGLREKEQFKENIGELALFILEKKGVLYGINEFEYNIDTLNNLEDKFIVYPLTQKQLYITPFMQLFRILDIELRRRNFWIIIGYSFRDVIIRTMFERALTENNKRKMLLVHLHATGQIRLLFKEPLQHHSFFHRHHNMMMKLLCSNY